MRDEFAEAINLLTQRTVEYQRTQLDLSKQVVEEILSLKERMSQLESDVQQYEAVLRLRVDKLEEQFGKLNERVDFLLEIIKTSSVRQVH